MRQRGESSVNMSLGLVGLSGLILMFWGTPDIADAVIHHLMRACS